MLFFHKLTHDIIIYVQYKNATSVPAPVTHIPATRLWSQLDSSVSYIIANASALRQRSLNTINPINRECERTPTAQSDYPIIHESRKRAHSDSAVRLNQSQNPDISALGTQGSRSIATGHLVRLTRSNTPLTRL